MVSPAPSSRKTSPRRTASSASCAPGITWINTYHPTYNEAPWGGYKQSGIGRELGTYGYDAYTEVKQINVNLDVVPSGWFSAD